MLPYDKYKEYICKALIFVILCKLAFMIDVKISVDRHILSNPTAFIAIASRVLQLIYIFKILKHNYYALREMADNDDLTEFEVMLKAFYIVSTLLWANHILYGGYNYIIFRIHLFWTDYF